MTDLMFVYGTLKRGFGNNDRCLKGAIFKGEATTTTATYRMLRIGFPIVFDALLSEVGSYISGEIFQVDVEHIATCDRLEGHPRMYRRMVRSFGLKGPKRTQLVKASIYIWQGETKGEVIKPDDRNVLTWDGYGR